MKTKFGFRYCNTELRYIKDRFTQFMDDLFVLMFIYIQSCPYNSFNAFHRKETLGLKPYSGGDSCLPSLKARVIQPINQ